MGAKRAAFCTRITDGLRDDLDKYAADNGITVSVASHLLMQIGLLAAKEGLVIHHSAKIELIKK